MALQRLENTLKAIDMSGARYLYGLDRTPDDRLNWKPTEQARSPLELAGHAISFTRFLSHYIQHRTFPERPETPPPPPSTRDEAKAALAAGFAGVRDTVSRLTEKDLAGEIQAPWGKMVPVEVMVVWLPMVLGYLQGQLNYVQVAYGDMDPNMPPDWGG